MQAYCKDGCYFSLFKHTSQQYQNRIPIILNVDACAKYSSDFCFQWKVRGVGGSIDDNYTIAMKKIICNITIVTRAINDITAQ